MANKKTAESGTDENKTKFISGDRPEFQYKRDRAQIMDFAKQIEYLQRNPTTNYTKSFMQYNKDIVKTYVQSPATNQDTLREISRFLWRNSMLYQRMIMYQASMPLFSYNITQENDFSKDITPDKAWRDYYKVVSEFNKFDIKREGYNTLCIALRDGFFVGFMYEEDKRFMMPLDVQYCRIMGKNASGQWVVYFDANFFNQGSNSEFVLGIEGHPEYATWDKVFIDGYQAFLNDRQNSRWFRLPPERTCCLICGPEDEFAYPLPAYLPIFPSLMDLLDLESILQSKNELENYKLIVSKIPLVDNGNSGDIDDFAISLELSNYFNSMIQNQVPDLIGSVVSPMEIETISFDRANSSGDTDTLGKAIRNLFNNSGVSEVVVAGGGTNPSTLAIRYGQIADMEITWVLVNRFESWLNYYISENISDGYLFEIFKLTDFNREDVINEKREVATLGGSVTDLVSAIDGNPYKAVSKLRFESALDIRSLMIPLQSSYNGGSVEDSEPGRPETPDSSISPSGDRTRNTAE